MKNYVENVYTPFHVFVIMSEKRLILFFENVKEVSRETNLSSELPSPFDYNPRCYTHAGKSDSNSDFPLSGIFAFLCFRLYLLHRVRNEV